MTYNEVTFCEMLRSCRQEQPFRLCVSAGIVHLASIFRSETFRVHFRPAHADLILSASMVAAGNASTVHSSSAAAQELVSFPRDIALYKVNA